MNNKTVLLELVPLQLDGLPARAIQTVPPAAAQAIAATIELFRRGGYSPPWISYLGVESDVAVGICGFKTPPQGNQVEIAYFTFPPNEGRGIAAAMARQLIHIALTAEPHVVVTARTLPQESASTAILKKLGMHCQGIVIDREDGEVWEWQFSPQH